MFSLVKEMRQPQVDRRSSIPQLNTRANITKGVYQTNYTFFLYENHYFASASIFLTFPEIDPEIFLNFS